MKGIDIQSWPSGPKNEDDTILSSQTGREYLELACPPHLIRFLGNGKVFFLGPVIYLRSLVSGFNVLALAGANWKSSAI